MTGIDESQTGTKIAGRDINNLRYADDTTLMAESEEELKRLLMKVKEDSKKRWLKTQHSKNEDHGTRYYHFMANRWGKCGNSIRYKLLGSKINTDGDCNHKMKKCLLLVRIAM